MSPCDTGLWTDEIAASLGDSLLAMTGGARLGLVPKLYLGTHLLLKLSFVRTAVHTRTARTGRASALLPGEQSCAGEEVCAGDTRRPWRVLGRSAASKTGTFPSTTWERVQRVQDSKDDMDDMDHKDNNAIREKETP